MMVKYTSILNTIEEYTNKCTNYPKANAIRFFKEHKDQFQMETWSDGSNGELIDGDTAPVGDLHKAQIELQEDVEYDGLEKGSAFLYSTSLFCDLQEYNNEEPSYGDLDFPVPVIDSETFDSYEDDIWDYDRERRTYEQISQHIDDAIKKSPGLKQPTLLFRKGRVDSDEWTYLEEGMKGKFKGFTGTSYNPRIPRKGMSWASWMSSDRYQLSIYAMPDVKCMVLNPQNGCHDWQAEVLFPRNQRYVVMERDDDKRTATLLFY